MHVSCVRLLIRLHPAHTETYHFPGARPCQRRRTCTTKRKLRPLGSTFPLRRWRTHCPRSSRSGCCRGTFRQGSSRKGLPWPPRAVRRRTWFPPDTPCSAKGLWCRQRCGLGRSCTACCCFKRERGWVAAHYGVRLRQRLRRMKDETGKEM